MTEQKPKLIILTGPTAVGKTKLSIELAKEVNGAIVSADSMQVYRGMDIGSAKIKKEEMQGIPHYLIDVLSPREEFHVAKFKELALDALQDIYQKGKLPIITGGTGFYIQALLYDVPFSEQKCEQSYREELAAFAAKHGVHALHEKLRQVDSNAADQIHENNVKRIIRALEYYHETGQPISAHNEAAKNQTSPYQFAYFVLNDDRDKLYARIDARVDEMIAEGLEDEVKKLKDAGYTGSEVSMQGLGYKEMLAYLRGDISKEDAIYKIKRDTRHFAKRQLTWFRRERDVIWLDRAQYQSDETLILNEMLRILKEKEIFTV
jgi:tRNA dimethylallyltransferase